MADTRYNQAISGVIAGALNTGAEIGLRNLLDRRAKETDAVTAIATIMSNNGTLDSLPTDVWKKMESKLGKDLGNILMYRSSLRKKQLAPRRAIERGVADTINRPVQVLTPMTEQQYNLPPDNAPPPEGDLELQDTTQRYGTRRVPSGGPAITLENPEQLQRLMVQNPQVAQVLQQYDISQRAPTDAERFMRADQLSPFGAALLTDDTKLGELAGVGQTLNVRRAELDYKLSKLASDKNKPTFGAVTEVMGPDGKPQKVWPMWTPDLGAQYLQVGEGPQKDNYTRIIRQLQQVEKEMTASNLTDAKRAELEKRHERLDAAFGKLIYKSGGITINNAPPIPVWDKDHKNIIDWMVPGGKSTRNQLADLYNTLQTGGKQRVLLNQDILSSGNLGLKTLQRLRKFISPSNVGRLGQLKRLGRRFMSNVQGLPELVSELQSTTSSMQPMLMEKLDSQRPGFESRMRAALNSTSIYDATLNAFAAIIAKFRDPKSTIREEEFNRIREEVGGLSYPEAVSKLSTLETELRTKMGQAQAELDFAELVTAQGLGITVPKPALGSPDIAYRRILIPDRIIPELAGATIQTPAPGTGPQTITPPPTGQQPTGQVNTLQFMQEVITEYGADRYSLNPTEWNELRGLINNSLANNKGLTDQQQRGAIRLIVQKYLRDKGVMPTSPGGR